MIDFDSQNNDITNIPLDKKVEPKKQTNSVFQIDNDYFKKKKTLYFGSIRCVCVKYFWSV